MTWCARSGTSRASSPSATSSATPRRTPSRIPSCPVRSADMSTTQHAGQVYALLSDGTTVQIRPATPDDFDAVKAMHEAMSADSSYLRFFNFSRLAAGTEARRLCRDPTPGNVALLALADGTGAGCASYAGTAPGVAEVAFA